jgi:hypothetical protein
VWDDYTLNQALWTEIQRSAMLTYWESVEVELTGERSGRRVQFRMPGPEREGLWWAEDADIIRQRPG